MRCANSECGEELEPAWAICPFCATSVAKRCAGCGRELNPRWKICPECKTATSSAGAGVSDGSGAFAGPASVSGGGSGSPFLTALEPASSPAPSASVPLLPAGSALGKYRIERVLGTGAYGTVYAAFDPGLGETLAVKAVGTFGDPEALRTALAAEYKVQRGLPDKRHILESYPPELVEAYGVRWVLLPMELASGTLREWLSVHGGKAKHLEQGLALLRQAVAGLEVLHAVGLVHRDVKPENLLLVADESLSETNDLRVKVADFGLASGLEKLASSRPELVGDGIGTPAYMAPEQVLAAHWKDVTPAADAYAIGTILFELLDGELPYSGTAEQVREKKRDRRLAPRTPPGPQHLTELSLALLRADGKERRVLREVGPRLVAITESEQAAWECALRGDSEAAYVEFLAQHPGGVYAIEARERKAERLRAREAKDREANVVIGIDLGTSNSAVAVLGADGEPVVILNFEGGRTTPSVVAFTKGGERLVGEIAKRQAVTNPINTLFSVKRYMGRRASEAKGDQSRVPYSLAAGPHDLVAIEVDGRRYTPFEVSAMILQNMKATAEAYFGHTVTKAVISVPSRFNETQRQATIDAGRIAGLNVLRIVDAPTLAAVAYGVDKSRRTRDERIVVLDLGGGTFDISTLEIYDVDGTRQFEVKSTNGDPHLGGDDFDLRIVDWLVAQFKRDQAVDLSKDPMAIQRLKQAAERAKMELSRANSTDINLPFIAHDQLGNRHLSYTLSRAQFEQLTNDLVQRTLERIKEALTDAGWQSREADEILLVGGSTRIPKIQQVVKDFFGKEPNRGVNPDEVVAWGAAIQGAVLTGKRKGVFLFDVTPLSLGIETLGGVKTTLIPRNTTFPTKKVETFSTDSDYQTSFEIHVLQGERELAMYNHTIGKFRLTGIAPAPRGVPQVEVTFDIDANGQLHVTARDKASGREQKVRIEASSGLSESEIDKMVKDAEKNAAEDKRYREEIDIRNRLDSQTYEVEKNVNEWGDKVAADLKTRIDASIARARKALRGDNINEIRAAQAELSKAYSEAGQAFYDNQSVAGAVRDWPRAVYLNEKEYENVDDKSPRSI